MKQKVNLIFILLLLSAPLQGTDHGLLFREDFHNLDDWKPLVFPEIAAHSVYTIASSGGRRYLRAESNASSSGLIYSKEFDVYEYPRLRWRWKVHSVYEAADGTKKEGDDYPIRVYVVFKYDPVRAGPLQRIIYRAARLRYGDYPPHSALNYVWASRSGPETIITNPYTERSRMILLQKGSEKAGLWVDEHLNIIEDYRRAFGEDPPATATLAIMNDSDNTGESAVSYIEFIEISR